MERILPTNILKQVHQALSPIEDRVEVLVFKGSQTTPNEHTEVGLQDETLALLREVAEQNDKISILERSLSDSEAQALGLNYAPTLLFREAGSQRSNIRFLGMPSGYEFSTLIETLVMLGTGNSGLGERSQAEISTLQQPISMQSFVTPGCPYCPKAVLTAYKLAFHNPQVTAEGIEANEFPQLSSRWNISGVPDTIISGQSQERVLGGQPDRVFVEAVLKAGGVA